MCKKLLIIDDDSNFVCRVMRTHPGHDISISTADSLKRAKAMINLDNFDMILANVKIPGGSSYSLKEEISKKNPGTKIIFMSGIEADYRSMKNYGEQCYKKNELDHIYEGIFAND